MPNIHHVGHGPIVTAKGSIRAKIKMENWFPVRPLDFRRSLYLQVALAWIKQGALINFYVVQEHTALLF
jgi:hypothetical protein